MIHRIKIIILFGILFAVTKLALAGSACDPAISNCLPDAEVATCVAQVCFIDSKGRKQFETENNCKFRKETCTNEIKEIPIEVLNEIFPSSTMLFAIADELNAALKLSATQGLINTKRKLAHFLAQVKQEIGASSTLTENFNYSAVGLMEFDYYQKHPKEAKQDGRLGSNRNPTQRPNKQLIANKVYGGRADLGNGSIASGDGWKYRGRGIIQLTGRYNYDVFNKQQKKIWGDNVDFIENPEDILKPQYAVRSALVFWQVKKMDSIAEKGVSKVESAAITAIVNKKTKTYDSRFKHLTEITKLDFFKECN